MEFTSKIVRDKLRNVYVCYAHFYNIEGIKCRRQLEVITKGNTSFNNGIATKTPDATLIMANPGTARPSDETKIEILTQPFQPGHLFDKTEFIKVDDEMDQTLWRVKEMMNKKKWLHVRVINLSDLRAGNDEAYRAMRKQYQSHPGWDKDAHSLFSDHREIELIKILAYNGGAPLIFAWGLANETQKEFANTCLTKLQNFPIQRLGVVSNRSGNKYNHPLAPGWVSTI